MLNWLLKFFYIAGASVCHQLPERSFFAGILKNPLCARCEGIYLGFFLSAIILFSMFRKKESDIAPLYVLLILIGFILSTVADGVLSYFAVITTNNVSRFVTGFLAGSAAVTIVYPVFNYNYYAVAQPGKIFSKPWHFAVFLAAILLLILAGLSGFKVFSYFYFSISALSEIFTFYFINLILVLLIPFFMKKADRLFSRFLAVPSVIALFLSGVELFISYRLHLLALNFAGRI